MASADDVSEPAIAFVRATIEALRPELESMPSDEEPWASVPLDFLPSRYDSVVYGTHLPLRDIDEWDDFTKSLKQSRNLTDRDLYGLHRTLGAIVSTVLHYYGLNPTDEQILNICSRLLEEFDTGSYRYRVIAPLFHYTHPDPLSSLSVGDDSIIELWNMTDTILHNEIHNMYLFPPRPSNDLMASIIIREFVSSDIGNDLDIAMDKVRQVVWAMRLVQPGDIAIPYFFVRAIGPTANAGYGFMAATRFQDLETRRKGTSYKVTESTFAQVDTIYTQLKSLRGSQPEFKGLGFALRRFNLSYSRDYDEDRLIDLASSLESALVPTQDVEIMYRLAWRAAILLAGVGEDPPTVRTHIKDIYSIRSAIVHGGKTLADFDRRKLKSNDLKNDIEQVIPVCERYTRLVLKQCVEQLATGLTSIQALEKIVDDKLVEAATGISSAART